MPENLKAWVIRFSGSHYFNRALFPFYELAEEKVFSIDSDLSSIPGERSLWPSVLNSGRFQLTPRRAGPMEKFFLENLNQRGIPSTLTRFRPRKSPPPHTVNLGRMVRKGLGRRLSEKISEKALPVLTSHPLPSLIADQYLYSLNYCIVSDANIGRIWASSSPFKSKITYLVPCGRVIYQLRSYGVPDENIFLTGYPIPRQILGNEDLDLLRSDLGQRLHHLDPRQRFWPLHGRNIRFFIGEENSVFNRDRPLTITYVIPAGGQQSGDGLLLTASLKDRLIKRELKLNLVAGADAALRDRYALGLIAQGMPEDSVHVIYDADQTGHYGRLCDVIRRTDILWTSPGELSFYSGLGLPVIIIPPETREEILNKSWLLETQSGIPQGNPSQANEWLMQYLNDGKLAEAAWGGFLKGRKYGTYKIEEILKTGTMLRESSPLKR